MNQNPIPQGKYKPAARHGNVIFTAGMTSRKEGRLLMSGKVSAREPVETYRKAVEQATENALSFAAERKGAAGGNVLGKKCRTMGGQRRPPLHGDRGCGLPRPACALVWQ